MTTLDCSSVHALNRRQVLALLAALRRYARCAGARRARRPPRVPTAWCWRMSACACSSTRAGRASASAARACTTHPAHVTVSLTGAKLKVTTPDGKVSFQGHSARHRILRPRRNPLGRDHRRRGNALLHHRVEGQGLEAEHVIGRQPARSVWVWNASARSRPKEVRNRHDRYSDRRGVARFALPRPRTLIGARPTSSCATARAVCLKRYRAERRATRSGNCVKTVERRLCLRPDR